ncbi:V-type ATP synthase subunit D [Nocardioides sp. T2.26MG-1]|uniref:V-type ATP synthase subunit D n=1 Tax=Nocardioides sp. T2.26MG-1 TaxID=3041166 RepID=UPI0024776303|nr:V-type ATP synthase subunit D [Nocardioides sp. T2.26MG-1]CAI9400295.1 V-type ATP synthase subunit D [Nocardioides sp. T2.26MG-1]
MPRRLHVPPGRAGQLWLVHRQEVALRAVDLLDQKLRILRSERLRRALVEERTRAAWEAAVRDADIWQLRLGQLGGQRALRLGRRDPVDVEVRWEQVVGVRYPAFAVVRGAASESSGGDEPGGSAVLLETRRRMEVALAAAAQQAAALAALRTLEAQEAATRRRLRSIRTRYLPLLQATRRDVEVSLEEDERSDLLRLRWAAGRGAAPSGNDRRRVDG